MKKKLYNILGLIVIGATALVSCSNSSDSGSSEINLSTKHIITYITEHGIKPESVTRYSEGAELYLTSADLPELSAMGYAFIGWYDGETKAVAGEFHIKGDVTLTAHWTAVNTYTVTFNTNGGSTIDSQTVNTGSKATEPTAPTKTGYIFAGWYSDEAFSNAFSFTTKISANITLYAKWVISGTVEEITAAINTLKDSADTTTTQNIKVTGTITSNSIAELKTAIKALNGVSYTASTWIALDFSEATGFTEISDNAFEDCYALTNITLPNSVTTIGTAAFSGCRNLENVNIPLGVTSIGASAFSSTKLKNVKVPNSVTSIDSNAFAFCTQLESISLPLYSGIKKLNGTFFGCTKLTSVSIPHTVTEIGSSTFYQSGLTNIIIPSSVTEIGYKAFSETALTTVTIPDLAVSTIGTSAFENCTLLSEVTIGKSVTSIGSKAFSGCTGLTKAAFTNKQYSSWTANTTGGQSENLSILDDTANATYLKTTYLGEWTRNN